MNALCRICCRIFVFAILAGPVYADSGIDRFGGTEKTLSFGVFLGSGFTSGAVSSQGTVDFSTGREADELFGAPQTIALEYGESIGKSSLATGLEYTRVEELNALSTALGLSQVPGITINYVDVPVTYRVNAFTPGQGEFNLFAGVALVAMFDIFNADEEIFLTGGESATTGGGAGDKHIDFGLGLGGEFGAEIHLRGAFYLAGKAGFRSPFTGVTRPKAGFVQFGFRWFEF